MRYENTSFGHRIEQSSDAGHIQIFVRGKMVRVYGRACRFVPQESNRFGNGKQGWDRSFEDASHDGNSKPLSPCMSKDTRCQARQAPVHDVQLVGRGRN